LMCIIQPVKKLCNLSSSSATSEFESGMRKLSSAGDCVTVGRVQCVHQWHLQVGPHLVWVGRPAVSALVSSKESCLCVGASQVCSVACMTCDLPVQR
jgi:hypothetical protein